MAAQQALAAGADLIVAWGGDGTVNEVASVVAGTPARMGIIPAGSGNGLARELAMPRSPARSLRHILQSRVKRIDLGLLDGTPFVNVAGFGLDGHVARCFNALSSRGFIRYLQVVLRELPRYTPLRYVIEYNGTTETSTALIVGCANSRQYGNGARLAPDAVLDDGLLDLVVVRPSSVLGDLFRARRFFTGTLHRDPRVSFARVAHVRIECDHVMSAHVDGEPVHSIGRRSDVQVWPGALQICV